MSILTEESLHINDLRDLVKPLIEIDSYKSKVGDDKDIVTVAFTVNGESPAKDLVSFIEKGYNFVLDSENSPGEVGDENYKVFCEIQRNSKVAENITILLYGVGKLTGITEFKFKYHKSFTSYPADEKNLRNIIPSTSSEYKDKISEHTYENFQNFFNKSYLESVEMLEENINFKKIYAEPIRLKFVSSGPKHEVLESISEKISINPSDIAEVMFLTKYIGNYNITKFGDKFMFENNGYAAVFTR